MIGAVLQRIAGSCHFGRRYEQFWPIGVNTCGGFLYIFGRWPIELVNGVGLRLHARFIFRGERAGGVPRRFRMSRPPPLGALALPVTGAVLSRPRGRSTSPNPPASGPPTRSASRCLPTPSSAPEHVDLHDLLSPMVDRDLVVPPPRVDGGVHVVYVVASVTDSGSAGLALGRPLRGFGPSGP